MEKHAMIAILVSVEPDLASSIALRYACQLASWMEVKLQPVHVKTPGQEGPAIGIGWARRTWEKELLEKGKTEIAPLLKADSNACPVLNEPLIFTGNHDEEILNELKRGSYDFFVEGVAAASPPATLHQKIHSRLYQLMPCPLVLVKNLVALDRVLIMQGEEAGPQGVLDEFWKMFASSKIAVDLLACRFQAGEVRVLQQEDEWHSRIQGVRQQLEVKGCFPREIRAVQGPAVKIGESFPEYGLVLASVDRRLGKKSQVLSVLEHVSSPILLCW